MMPEAKAEAKAVRGIIFDCDGVMIDSSEANILYYNRILRYCGLPLMTPEEERFCVMASVRQSLTRLLPASLHPRLDEIAHAAVDYGRDILPKCREFPGFRAFACRAHAAGVRLAVLSNRTDAGMQAVLDILHFPPYFNPVMTSSCGFTKPHPGGALAILKAWSLPAEEVILVGDSDADRGAAAGAGIPFVRMKSAWADACAEPEPGCFAIGGYGELAERMAACTPGF